MSAIWGYISWEASLPMDAKEIMETPYKRNCKIDRYEYVSKAQSFFASGLQYMTPEAEREVLPIEDSKRGIVFTADCLLDNRDEVIAHLLDSHVSLPEDLSLSTDTSNTISTLPDGSLMYLLYLIHGMDLLLYVRGQFSLAVYDTAGATLHLATDQVSSRSLYYYRDAEHVVFSTLLDPLRALGHTELNDAYMRDYLYAPALTPCLVADESPIKDVYKLLPGHFITITRDSCTDHTYWELTAPSLARSLTPDSVNSSRPENVYTHVKNYKKAHEYTEYFDALYTEAVRDTLRTNGHTAIAMSSGYDSASVGAIAADLLATRDEPLYTYTYVPSEEPIDEHTKGFIYDETEPVREIAALHPNMRLHFLSNNGKNCFQDLDSFLGIMNIPFKAFINLPNLAEVYSHAADSGCHLVLTGQCGNFTVSNGYIDTVLYDLYCKRDYYHLFQYMNHYCLHEHLPRRSTFLSNLSEYRYMDKLRRKKVRFTDISNPFVTEAINDHYSFSDRIQCDLMSFCSGYVAAEEYHKHYLGLTSSYTFLGELETVLSLHYGVVLRDPTRDIRIIAFCRALPYRYFAYMGQPRYLIYSTMQGRLPASILEKWSRYGVQNSDWLTRVSRDLDTVLPPIRETLSRASEDPLIDSRKINDFISSLRSPLEYKDNDYFIYLTIIYLYCKYKERSLKESQ